MGQTFDDLMVSAEGRAMLRALEGTGRCGIPVGAREGADELAQLLNEQVLPRVGVVRAWVQELRGVHHVCIELARDA
jgi:hypothetical protein